MKTRALFLITALCSTLAACGDRGSSPSSNVTMGTKPTVSLAAGYSISGDLAGSYAEAFMSADGSGFMSVATGDDQPAQALYVFGLNGVFGLNDVVNRKPAGISGSVSVDSTTAAPLTVTVLTMATVTGGYSTLVGGQAADFNIATDGRVTAGSTTCKVSGSVAANGPLGTLSGTLNTSNCGASSARYTSYLIRSPDYAPASLRIVGYSSSDILDIFAY